MGADCSPNIWVPKSKVISEEKEALPSEVGGAVEEMVMLRGYPNIWVPKSRVK